MSTTPDSTFTGPEQRIADLERQLAECKAERDEALQRGTATAEVLGVINQIGFSERSGYAAIGTVCNLAARLCAEAKDGQILVSSRIAEAMEEVVKLEDLGDLELKGLRRPVATFNVVQSTSAVGRPNLTVVASEPGA